MANKDRKFTLRFTAKEWDGIAHRANREDLPIGEYLRRMIDLGARADHRDGSLNW